ncbi:MAG: DUF4424 family protein [Prevotella sp.]|nr:DUF4424 family protein [Prevotella sp.]
MKLRTMMIIAALGISMLSAVANDGVYYVRGAELVPVRETEVSVRSEVLTISLCDDGFAKVDVDYEFYNHGAEKTIQMGFEAAKPYNTEDTLNPKGIHPYIYGFTVEVNGEKMPYRNAVVEPGLLDTPYTGIKDDRPEEFEQYSYAYCFDALMKKGVNRVHHTYSYKMSYGVGRTFEVPYWLTPAARWQGGVIEHFTLRIKAPNTAKHFVMADSTFRAAEFKVVEGVGKVRHIKEGWMSVVEIALRNGTVEWKVDNFRPSEDFCIQSADTYISFNEKYPVGTFYDRSDKFVVWPQERKAPASIARNMPFAHRGYVFKKKSLRSFFESLWWYMPDESYQPTTADFTPREWRFMKDCR